MEEELQEEQKVLKYEPRSEEDLKKLAKDIVSNMVFLSTFMTEREEESLLPTVFMPLSFSSEEMLKGLAECKIVALYEYYDKAGPGSINGYPIFLSMHLLNKEDYKKVSNFVSKLRAAQEEALK